MFYERDEFKQLKKKTSRDCMICIGKCSGHKGIDEKEPVSILVANTGIFLERGKGQDAMIAMEDIRAFRESERTVQVRTVDAQAKKITLFIGSPHNRMKTCKVIERYMPKLKPKEDTAE